jgi:hypothetical protein
MCNRFLPIMHEARMEVFVRMLPPTLREPTEGDGDTHYRTYRHKTCGAILEIAERPRKARAA